MQVCDIIFQIVDKEHGDQVLFANPKRDVTVAEIALLRALHGPASIGKISPTRQDARPHAQERDRLALTYGEKAVAAAFPGAAPRLPSTLADIGESIQEILDEPVPQTAAVPVVQRAVPKAKIAHKPKAKPGNAKKRRRGVYGDSDEDTTDVPDTAVGGDHPLHAPAP